MSVTLADYDDRLVFGGGHRPGPDSRSPGGLDRGDGLGDRRLRDPLRSPFSGEAPIDFLRAEVVEICAALALGGSLLRRLGLGAEASRLEALFGAVEARLAEMPPSVAT